MTRGPDTLALSSKLRVYAASGCAQTLKLSPEVARDVADVLDFAETMRPRFDALRASISVAERQMDKTHDMVVRCFLVYAVFTWAIVVLL